MLGEWQAGQRAVSTTRGRCSRCGRRRRQVQRWRSTPGSTRGSPSWWSGTPPAAMRSSSRCTATPRTLDRHLSFALSITASCRAALKGCSVKSFPGQRWGRQRGTQAVTPFEIEPDPEEEALREANARREAEAGARAARIRAKARRWARIAPATSMHGTDVT